MADNFEYVDPKLQVIPADHAFAITPTDGVDLSFVTRGLYVGTAGNVAVILKGDSSAVTFVGVPAGSVIPLRVSRVNSTNTTASDIVGLY